VIAVTIVTVVFVMIAIVKLDLVVTFGLVVTIVTIVQYDLIVVAAIFD